MAFEGFRLLSQIGAGRDGGSYRAMAVDGQTVVELHDLSAARADVERWRVLSRRLRLASIVKHPGAVALRSLVLDGDSPFVVLDCAGDGRPMIGPGASLSDDRELGVVRHGMHLAGALTTAHRIGLVHGGLGLGADLGMDPRRERLDFTGIETDRRGRRADAVCDGDDSDLPQKSAPEVEGGQAPDEATDVYGLGVLLSRLASSGATSESGTRSGVEPITMAVRDPFDRLVAQMLALDPAERPSAREVEARLAAILAAARSLPTGGLRAMKDHSAETIQETHVLVENAEIERPWTLGRFRILEALGEGGQGVVYRAEDPIDGSVVAIKVLRAERSGRPDAVRRFRKEARLMAEVNNPFVVNLLEFNEESDVPYLVLELVEGRNLKDMLDERRRLDEQTALSIMVDVARGLMGPHDRGIIHRDIKPANILFLGPHPDQVDESRSHLAGGTEEACAEGGEMVDLSPRPSDFPIRTRSSNGRLHAPVKISDFGLARHVVDSQSMAVTDAGSIMGTPHYMAPEQCDSLPVDSRTDIYAMGATLFHMLAGRPPFEADELDKLLAMHRREPPPALDRINPLLSEGVCRVVAKALAKAPGDRYHDAQAMHRDLERLLSGEPTEIAVHPAIPACNPEEIISFEFTWDLKASPRDLWPYVSNTERVNRALGLTAPRFSTRFDPTHGVERFASFRKYLNFIWREHPFEWMEGRRFGVLREFSEGLFHWFHSLVELDPAPGGGTRLTHRIRVRPNGRLGRVMAYYELGRKGGRNLERVYKRIDAAITGRLGNQPWLDPFESPHELSVVQRIRLDRILDHLVERGVELFLAEPIGEFVARAPAQEVARIRPLALAKRLELDPDSVVAACLLGAREGLFTLHWDLLCPVCRISSEVVDTLKAIRDHGRCVACNLDFELDFASSVEMILRVHPKIREVETGIFCIGGPAHSPHVLAQVRVAAGERIELQPALPEGAYRLRGPQLAWSADFRVQPLASSRRWEFVLGRGPADDPPHVFKAGDQVFTITNDQDVELVVRIERQVAREDVLTAAQASTIATFRELFPGEILSSGQFVSVTNLCFLAVGPDPAALDEMYRELGDARVFAVLQEHGRAIEEAVKRGGGAVVRPLDDGVLAAFYDPAAATRVASELIAGSTDPAVSQSIVLRAAIHLGPVLTAATQDHLDYFGATVHHATAGLFPLAKGGEMVLSRAVASDLAVADLIADIGVEGKVMTLEDRDSKPIAVVFPASSLAAIPNRNPVVSHSNRPESTDQGRPW